MQLSKNQENHTQFSYSNQQVAKGHYVYGFGQEKKAGSANVQTPKKLFIRENFVRLEHFAVTKC